MKKQITFNATCRNCLNFEILGDAGIYNIKVSQ